MSRRSPIKAALRSRPVQAVLATVLSSYLGFALSTMRWRYVNREPADAAVRSPEGVIGCFWHGRMALAVHCRTVLADKPRRVLISLSRDGEFVAGVVGRLGFPAIRGSSGKNRDPAKARDGARAFRESMEWLRSGGCLAVTPDGPRGPAAVMPDGPLALARASGAPVFLFGLAARPAVSIRTWDRAVLPLPFSRGVVVFDGPHRAPADAGPEDLQALRRDWEARLNAAELRAEAELR